jgi:hypothetical protein
MRHRKPGRPGGITAKGWAPLKAGDANAAVAAITGIPLDDLCGFVLVAQEHRGGMHYPVTVPGCSVEQALWLLELSAADIRTDMEKGTL